MKKIAPFFFGFLFCISACKQAEKPLTQEEVIAVIQKFDDGWRQKNLSMVDSVLAPAYIYFTQSGGLFSRDSVVQTAGSPAYTLDTMSRREFAVELHGTTAIVSTRWRGKGVYKELPFDEDQRCSITVIKEKGRVMIAAEHCTPIKPVRVFH
jgi:Domain of unknown function (DUF4440)